MGGWVGVGLNDNNAILNSVDVVVEVGVELGKISTKEGHNYHLAEKNASGIK